MIGQKIHNYEITALLGEGGMGTVYKATDTVLGREVALKMLHAQLVNQSQFLERFKKEARILAQLLHPNIAVIYNFIEFEGRHYMVMEFVEGNNLDTTLRQKGTLSYRTVVPIVLQALEGLNHAHKKGILHRDIKPANLILNEEATVKLMDFGIARIAGEQRLTQVARVIGTLEYLAPELIDGKEPSMASDIYALGIMMYELLTGKLPFTANTDYNLMQQILKTNPVSPEKLNAAVPKALSEIILKALNKKLSERFADAKEFQQALLRSFPGLTNINVADLRSEIPATRVMDAPGAMTTAATVMQELPRKNMKSLLTGWSSRYKPAQLFVIACILVTFVIITVSLAGSKQQNNFNPAAIKKKDTMVTLADLPVNNPDPVPIPPAEGSGVKPVEDQETIKAKDNPSRKEIVRPVVKDKKQVEDIVIPETKQDEAVSKKEEVPVKTERRIYIDRTIRVVLVLSGNPGSDLRVGQRISMEVQKPVVIDGKTIIAEGAEGEARVTEVSKRKTVIVMDNVKATNGQTIHFEEEDIAGRGDKVLDRKHYIGIIRKGLTLTY